MNTNCAYPECESEAEEKYRCGECGEHFCAMHIHQSGGYICKMHFEQFVEPGIDALKSSSSRNIDLLPSALKNWLSKLSGNQ